MSPRTTEESVNGRARNLDGELSFSHSAAAVMQIDRIVRPVHNPYVCVCVSLRFYGDMSAIILEQQEISDMVLVPVRHLAVACCRMSAAAGCRRAYLSSEFRAE